MQVNIARPLLKLTVEAPKLGDALCVQLLSSDVGLRKALGKVYKAVLDKETPGGTRLEATRGRMPEPGEKRAMGLWWTLAGSYADQRSVRDQAIDWWLDTLENEAKRSGFKLSAPE